MFLGDFAPMGTDDPVDNRQMMNTWIIECKQSHELCSMNIEYFLLIRVLDLQAFENGDDIKLVSLDMEDFDHKNIHPE